MPRISRDRRTTPAAVVGVIRQLGANIAAARQRRRWTQKERATKAGVSRLTVIHVEQGQPGTSIEAYAATLWAMGLHASVDDVAWLAHDPGGATLMESRTSGPVRHSARADDDF